MRGRWSGRISLPLPLPRRGPEGCHLRSDWSVRRQVKRQHVGRRLSHLSIASERSGARAGRVLHFSHLIRDDRHTRERRVCAGWSNLNNAVRGRVHAIVVCVKGEGRPKDPRVRAPYFARAENYFSNAGAGQCGASVCPGILTCATHSICVQCTTDSVRLIANGHCDGE